MPSARCAYRVPNGTTFFEHGGALAAGYLPTDRDHPIRQVAGAAFRMHRDARRLSELRVAAGETPADDPFIPTLLDVFLAYLTGSPEAALAILDAHARGPDVSIDQVLEPPFVSPPLLDARERFFTAAGTAKSVRAFVADARAALDAALEQAAREIQQHMPEAVPHVGESSAAPWLEVAKAAKECGHRRARPEVQEHHPRLFRCHRFSPEADLGHDALVRRLRRALHEGQRQSHSRGQHSQGRRGSGQLEVVGDRPAVAIDPHSRRRGRRALAQPCRVLFRL